MSQQGPHFSPLSKAKAKLVTSDISDIAIASVHSEKTRLKKLIMIIVESHVKDFLLGICHLLSIQQV